MKDNLCMPCTTTLVERITAKAKYLPYRVQKSNLTDLVENEYFKKNPQPNFQIEMGNRHWSTATDRFNLSDYEKLVNEIETEPLMIAPQLEDIDETINSN